jgi:hypothetical protein
MKETLGITALVRRPRMHGDKIDGSIYAHAMILRPLQRNPKVRNVKVT